MEKRLIIFALISVGILGFASLKWGQDRPLSDEEREALIAGWNEDGQFDDREWSEMAERLPSMYRLFVLGSEISLGRMGYAPGPFDGVLDEATIKAFKAYQKDRGLRQTGGVNDETNRKLQEDALSLNGDLVLLPSLHVFTGFWDSEVLATGTWIIEEREQAHPFQSTRIHCRRDWGVCIDATTIIYPATLMSEDPSLDLDVTTYSVERWDEHEIVTRPDDKACVRYTLRISRQQELVTGLRSTIDRDSEYCKGHEKEDLRLQLADGTEVYMEQWKKYQEKARELILADWGSVDEGAAP